MTLRPFHLAVPVDDLEAARAFYVGKLGCGLGRESDEWIDFDLMGHQVVVHQVEGHVAGAPTNAVDGHDVPVPHFGVVLEWSSWESLAERLGAAGVDFVIEPYTRFRGEPGEQGTFFVRDPAGNALEFKTFRDLDQLFAR